MQDLPLDRLGPYPILQFAVAIIIVGGFTYAVWKGIRDRKPSHMKQPNEQLWFFDGPIARLLSVLEKIEGHQARQVEFKGDELEERRHLNNLIRDVKNNLENRRDR